MCSCVTLFSLLEILRLRMESDRFFTTPCRGTNSTLAHVKLKMAFYKDFSNSLDLLWVFILFLLSNFHRFNKKRWHLKIKFREDLSRCWWYKVFAECPLCFISKNCFWTYAIYCICKCLKTGWIIYHLPVNVMSQWTSNFISFQSPNIT